MIEKFSSVPQSNIAKYSRPHHPCPSVHQIICDVSANGTGINTRNLYTTRIIIVKSNFFLTDLFVNISVT